MVSDDHGDDRRNFLNALAAGSPPVKFILVFGLLLNVELGLFFAAS